MAYDEQLADRVRQALRRRKNVSEQKMFGGVGFLLNGNMCCGVLRRDLILRLGADRAEEALREPHTHPFDITGRAMKGWVMVAPEGSADDDQLHGWVRQAARFASSLPPK